MENKKNIGIWMDHSTANFINVGSAKNNFSVNSKFTTEVKEEALNKNENLMHNKEQQMHEAYYKEIADEILTYDGVLLFGPTNAKTELHNFLKKDLHFKDITFDVVAADKMSSNEKEAFVKSHFKK
jgi:hypothetical protein